MIYLKLQTVLPITQLYWPILPLFKQRLPQKILRPFAEVAKKVQLETAEVMIAANNDVSADASAAMNTTTSVAKSTPAAKPAVKAAKYFKLLELRKTLPEKAWMPALFFATLIYGLG